MGCTISSQIANDAGIVVYDPTTMNVWPITETILVEDNNSISYEYNFEYTDEELLELSNEERPTTNQVLIGCSNPFNDLLYYDDVVPSGFKPSICEVYENSSNGGNPYQGATVDQGEIYDGVLKCLFPSSFTFEEGTKFGNHGGGGSSFSDQNDVQMINFHDDSHHFRITSIRVASAKYGNNGYFEVPFRYEITYSDGTTVSNGYIHVDYNHELIFDHNTGGIDEYITEVAITEGGACSNNPNPGGSCQNGIIIGLEIRTNKSNSIIAGDGLSPPNLQEEIRHVITPNVETQMIVGFHGSRGSVINTLGVVTVQKSLN